MIAVPATPATTTAVTSGPIQRIAVSTKKPPSRSSAPNSERTPAACRPGAPRLRAKVEISSGNQESLQHEEELPDQLLAVGIGRPHRGDDRLRGEDHHLPHLLEGGLGGQEGPRLGLRLATSSSPCRAGPRPARAGPSPSSSSSSASRRARASPTCLARSSAARCASESWAISVSRVCSSSSTPATWASEKRARGRHVAGQVARVGGQLGLEPGDLAAQLVAHLDRLALFGEVGKVGAAARRRDLLQLARHARAGGRDDRPGRGGRAPPRARAAARRRRSPPARGAASMPSATKVPWPWRLTTRPASSRPGVDRPHRVDVDPRPLGEAAEARQPLARREPAGGDQRPQAPGELNADRQLRGRVGRERRGLAVRGSAVPS